MNFNAKSLLIAAFSLLACGSMMAQDVKVDYTKYPDANPNAKGPTKVQIVKSTATPGSAKGGSYAKTRPDHVNNALTKYYPPVFNQDGGSCGSAQAVGYCMTYDMNAYRNTDASLEENQLPTHFTWLHTYAGVEKYPIMNKHGVPNVIDYGGRTYSRTFGNQDTSSKDYGYMQGYDKWYRAMFNRTVGGDTFCDGNQMTEIGREQLKEWLWNHWGDLDFYAGGVSGIGVASGGTWGKILSTPANQAAGVVGKRCVTTWGKTYDHALTIVGYDDRIEFDLDTNGIFGEKDKDEVGAWIVCNSWGAGWCDGGFVYCPYKYSYAVGTNQSPMNSGHYTWRKGYEPKRTFKILMDYTHRSEICISAGINSDTSAVEPKDIDDMPFFHYAGDGSKSNPAPAVPMLGKWKTTLHHEPMEFGYDVTDLSSSYNLAEPVKYFLQIQSKAGAIGSGHVYKFSYIDYELEPQGMEIPARIDTVNVLGGGKTTLISLTVPARQLYAPLNTSLIGNKFSWNKPKESSYLISRYYIYKGSEKIAEVPSISNSYVVDDPDATYSVATAYDYKGRVLLSDKSIPARKATYTPQTETNKTLDALGGSIYVPGLLADGLKQGTIEFWLKPSTIASNCQQIGEGWGTFMFCTNPSGQIYCGWDTNNRVTTASNTLKANNWYHIAIVVDYNTITVYVNGLKKGSTTSTSYSGIPAIKNFYIGVPHNEMGTLDGEIDEFRVWNTVRMQNELVWNKGTHIANPSALSSLVAYYPMNTYEKGNVTYLKDMASSYDGIINNATLGENATLLPGVTGSPVATFSVGSSTIYAGDPVLFRSEAKANTISWKWNVPGATSAIADVATPYITFPKAGTYDVTHIVTDENNVTTESTTSVTVVNPEAPVADFEIAETSLNEGENFCFANMSTGANCTHTWSLPGADIEEMHSVNACVAYRQTGKFPVTLTVTNAGGTATCTKYVEVAHTVPVVAFKVDPSTIMIGETTYLVDESRGNPDSWRWTISNSKHTYYVNGQLSSFTPTTTGVYDVTLEATNDMGTNSLTETGRLLVINADSKNGLNFTGSESLISTTSPFPTGNKAFTIEWWMNPAETAGALNMASENGMFSATTDFNGKMTVTVNGKSVASDDNFVLTDGWHHYAITYTFGTVKFYRDAVLISSPSTRISTSTTDWGLLTISTGTNHYKGQLDELRIWSKCLSLSNMKEYINAPITDIDKATSAGLVAYYDFNQNGGSVIDRTPNHIDLTRSGFGPDGDAWGLSLGVFTLDLGEASDPVELEADGLTSVYDAVKNGKQEQFSAVKNGIRIVAEEPTMVSIYSLDGQCIINDMVEGVHILPFHPGIYIVNGRKLRVE